MKQTRRQSGGASRIVRRPGESIPGSISTTHRKTKSRLAVPDSAMPSNRGNSAAAASSPVVLNEHSPIASESDFLSLVFEFLPYQQILGRCSAVCRAWSQISTSKIEEWKLLETKAHAVRGLKGRSAGKLRGPSGLTVLPDGTLSVVDFLNHRIQLVSARSASLPTSGSIRADHVEATLVEGHLQGPTGVVPDGKGALIVGDKQGHCIYRLALPGYRPKKIGADGPPTPISAGTILARVGNHGREKDELWDPEGLAIDDDGLIYVADSGNHRIVVYELSDDGFSRLRSIGTMGFGDGQLSSPFGVCVAPKSLGGLVYVADTLGNRIACFSRVGDFVKCLGVATNPGRPCAAPGHFELPRNLAIVRGFLVVIEDRRLQVLTLQGAPRQVVEFGGGPDHLAPPGGQRSPGASPRDKQEGSADAEADPFDEAGLWGVAADTQRVYVSDARRHRLHVFSLRHGVDARG